MRNRAEHILPRGKREQDALGAQPRDGFVRRQAEAGRVELHEIGLDLVDFDGKAGFCQSLREPAGVGVVLRKPVDVVVERVDAGGRHDPGLAHRASEEVLEASRLRHAFPRPCDDRS